MFRRFLRWRLLSISEKANFTTWSTYLWFRMFLGVVVVVVGSILMTAVELAPLMVPGLKTGMGHGDANIPLERVHTFSMACRLGPFAMGIGPDVRLMSVMKARRSAYQIRLRSPDLRHLRCG